MSSEGVLVLSLVLGGVALAGIAICGVGSCAYGAGKIIKGIVDKQVESAMRRMEAEKEEIREWQTFQEAQRKQMLEYQNIHQALAESEKRLASLSLSSVKVTERRTPKAKGYVSLATDDTAIDLLLKEIATILEGLPSEFTDAPQSPFVRLVRQQHRFHKKLEAGKSLLVDEILSFKEAITRTLNGYLNELALKHARQTDLQRRVESLLSDVLTFTHLTREHTHTTELATIRNALIGMLITPLKISGQIEILERKFASVKADISSAVASAAFRPVFAASVTRNLASMGYQPVEEFPHTMEGTIRARMRMPEGEYVNIAIHSNNTVSFQLSHATTNREKIMSAEKLAIFRKQEENWCNDLHLLIRRLTAEGFEYRIGFERLVPEASIPVVIVECADEIVTEEDDEDANRFFSEQKKIC